MAHTIRSPHEVPQTPLSRPTLPPAAWIALALAALAALAYGFIVVGRGPSLVTRPGIPVERPPGPVRVWSSLSELKSGKTGPTVALAEVPTGPGMVGVGSLSELRGEVAVVRGTTWVAYALSDGTTRTMRLERDRESATFLAVASVPSWHDDMVSAPLSLDQLADEVERRATRLGLDRSAPIPLTVDGTFSDIRLNVVNGPAIGSDQPNDERLRETAIRYSVPSAEGTIVGFFAAQNGERLIHEGERLHLHVVLPNERRMGHLDSATVGAGAVLRLPAARR